MLLKTQNLGLGHEDSGSGAAAAATRGAACFNAYIYIELATKAGRGERAASGV